MSRLLVILLATVLIAGCKVGSGGGDLGMGSYYDSGSSVISASPYTSGSDTGSGDTPSYPQPEPSTIILLGVGLGGLLLAKLKKNKKA